MSLQRLLTSEELANLLGIPVRTLRQWRYVGRGPRYLKFAATVRYRASDVEAWLEEHEHDPGTAADSSAQESVDETGHRRIG